MSSTPQTIHHIVPSSELVRGCSDDTYSPARLAADGFAHCSGSQAITLAVAADYYSDVQESLWVLEIDPTKLESELRFEAPAPIPGGGRGHLERAETFPHVYGPIERRAIRGVGLLERDGSGFRWPRSFRALDEVLALL